MVGWNGAQSIVVNRLHSTWTPVRSGVPQGSILEHNLFNIFANDLKEATECPLVRLAPDTKLGEQLIRSKGGLPFRGTQTGWRNGLRRILSNSTWKNAKSCTQEESLAVIQVEDWLAGEQLCGKSAGVLAESKLHLSQWQQRRPTASSSELREAQPIKQVIISLCSALTRPHLEYHV